MSIWCQSKTKTDCFVSFIRGVLNRQETADADHLKDLQTISDANSLQGIFDDDFSVIIEGENPFSPQEEFNLIQ